MRPGDIDRADKVWIYTPAHHKTEHHGRQRVIALGPQAQEVLRPFLNRVPAPPEDRELFSPAEAEQERMHALRASRRSKVPPSQANRRREGAKTKGDAYSVAAYRRAINHGVEQANAARMRAAAETAIAGLLSDGAAAALSRALQRVSASRLRRARNADNPVEAIEVLLPARHADSLRRSDGMPAEFSGLGHRIAHAMGTAELLPTWHPHQLRHTAATRIRKEHGLEAARVVLGHAGAAVTELYAEIDHEKARWIAYQSG
jgi:integrase